MRKTLASLFIVGVTFLGGCYRPAPGVNAKNAIWPGEFEDVMGRKYPYCEERVVGYDVTGRDIVFREYCEENPNSLGNSLAKFRLYIEFKKRGVDLLEIGD